MQKLLILPCLAEIATRHRLSGLIFLTRTGSGKRLAPNLLHWLISLMLTTKLQKETASLKNSQQRKDEIERVKKYGNAAGALHTDLHECVGHASGKLADGTDPAALKNYASALEEARADLFALYFMMDRKIIELELLPGAEAAKAEYDSYIETDL